MKKHFLSVLLLFLVISCSIESKFGLPNDEKINTDLIGQWYNEKNNNEKLTILKQNEKTYTLVFKDQEETNELISYSKTINGFEIMTIKTEYKNTITNVFYGFSVNGDTLTFYEVNDQLRNNDFESDTDLLNFFEENITKDNFFVNAIELKRK